MSADNYPKTTMLEVYRGTGLIFRGFMWICVATGLLIALFGVLLLAEGPFEFFAELAAYIKSQHGSLKTALSEIFSWALATFLIPLVALILLRNAENEMRKKAAQKRTRAASPD